MSCPSEELAFQLQHGSAEFWHRTLSHCAALLEASRFYEAHHISILALLFADLCAGPTTPYVMPDDLKNRAFTTVASALLEIHGQCEVSNLADLAIAILRADFKNEMLQRRILAQATRHLAEISVTGAILRVADHHHARRLLAAVCHTHGKEIIEMNHHIAKAAKFLEFVLTIISYDAISWFPAVQEPYDEESLTRFMMRHRRGSSVFSLIMFPVYVLAGT
eukprot:s1864_g4.t1